MEHALNWREEWKEADEEQKPNENLPTETCEKSKSFYSLKEIGALNSFF